MSGRWIDRAALTAFGAAGLYLFFMNAGFNIAASCVLAFVCMLLIRHAVRHCPWRLPYTRKQAAMALYAIAEMEEDAAKRALTALTVHTDAPIIPLPRHPDTELSAGELYALWQAHRDAERIVISTNAAMSSTAGNLVSTLNRPSVRVVDQRALVNIIRRTGRYIPEKPRRASIGMRTRRIFAEVGRRRASPRMLFTGVSLLSMYLLLGRGAYLVAAMATLFVTGALWINNGLRWHGSA